MNINPSDKDVRQGFSIAQIGSTESTLQVESPSPAQQRSTTNKVQQDWPDQDGIEAKSQSAAQAADKRTAQEAAEKIGEKLKSSGTDLRIRVLEDSQSQVQVEIVDEKSNKVLRKIPQDDLVKLSASIKAMTGVLLDNPA